MHSRPRRIKWRLRLHIAHHVMRGHCAGDDRRTPINRTACKTPYLSATRPELRRYILKHPARVSVQMQWYTQVVPGLSDYDSASFTMQQNR